MDRKESHWLLLDSAASGDMAGLQRAIDAGADIDGITTYKFRAALHVATIGGQHEVLKHLIKLGADVNNEDTKENYTPLIYAIIHGDTEAMKILIDNGASLAQADAVNGGLMCVTAAACTAKNADAVWDLLLHPDTGLEGSQSPATLMTPQLMTVVVDGIIGNDSPPTDPQALAAMIRHGANWGDTDFISGSVLFGLIKGIEGGPLTFIPRVAEALKYTLEAGVPPFMENTAGVPAYETALEVPEFHSVFREACAHLAKTVETFRPGIDKLVDGDGNLTELALYCCYEDRLGELLAPGRWSDLSELIQAKQALSAALPEHYRVKYDALMDNAGIWRSAAQGKSALERLTRPKNQPGVG